MNLLTMKNIHKAYTDKVLFKGADFSVNSGDKIGVIGINGTGKSTLLKMIAGLDTCDAGLVVRGNNIVVNYLPQSPTFDDNETIYEHVITANSTEENKWSIEGDARAILDQLGFNDTGIPVSTLSGGQKKKVALAAALLSNCDILVLDEPTNHLDNDMTEYLEEYLNNYKGALVMVTHDRYFLDRVVDRIFAFEAGGHLTQYEGGYTDYRDKCVSSIYNVASNGTSDTSKSKAAGQVKKAYNSHEDKIKFTYMEQKEYETIDDDIEELENRVSELDDEIAKNATSYSKLAELTKEKEDVERQLEEKMERWEYLNDLAEKIEKQKQ